jgi:putative DNA primase/helicase
LEKNHRQGLRLVSQDLSGRELANRIVSALGGRWHGSYALCRCPTHEDQQPSFSVRFGDPLPLLKCFANCDRSTIIAELRARKLWPEGSEGDSASRQPRHPPIRIGGVSVAESMQGYQRALEIWDAARPAGGTLVEQYLRARGIRIPKISDQLRYAPSLKHRESKQSFPAMVARLSNDKGFVCIQRTWLDGPKKADVLSVKKCLGRMDNSAVRFRMPRTETLGLAEGIETALSASQLYSFAVWAVCGLDRLSKIQIPKSVHHVIIFGDAGAGARDKSFAAAREYEDRGLTAEVIFPATQFGNEKDFNDVRVA